MSFMVGWLAFEFWKIYDFDTALTFVGLYYISKILRSL